MNLKLKLSIYKLSVFTLFILVCCSIIPQIKTIAIFNKLWLLLILLWLLLTFISWPEFYIKPDIHRLLTYFFILYTFIISYITNNGIVGNRYLEISQIFVFYWAYLIGCKKDDNISNKKIIIYILPIVFYVSFITMREYTINPIVSRAVKPATEAGQMLLSKGIGGYEFIYFLVFLSTIGIYILKYYPLNIIRRIIYTNLILFLFLNIFMSGFMTASLLAIVSIFFLFIMPKIKFKTLFFIALLIFFMNLFAVHLINGALYISEIMFPDSMNVKRLMELRTLFESGVVQSSIDARFSAYTKSINSFYSFPLMGIITTDIIDQNGNLTGFGQHSFIFDTFALFGLLLGVLLIYLITKPILKQRYLYKKSKLNLSDAILFIMLVFTMLNNNVPAVGFVIFFVFPIIHRELHKS